MGRQKGALRPDFVQHMSLGDRWPSGAAYENWEASKGEGTRHGEYGKLKKGELVSTRLIVNFVQFLAERAADGKEPEAVQAATEFLHTISIQGFHQHSAPVIAKSLLAGDDDDFLGRDVGGLVDLLLSLPKCERFVNACNDEQDVHDAVRWMFVACGQQVAASESLSCEEAIHVASDHMRTSLSDYQQRAIAWWKFDPWTVMLARGDRIAKTGMSIVLPLSQASYETIRAGAQMGYETLSSGLERPSRIVLLEGVAQRPEALGGEDGNTSKHAYLTMICQIAILSHCVDHRRDTPLRAISFAATPRTERNLRKTNFKFVGAKFRNTDIRIFERVLGRSGKDTVLNFILNGIGAQADRLLTPPRNLGPKKRPRD